MDARNILPRCIHSLRVHVAEHACKRDDEDRARLERERERGSGKAQEAGRRGPSRETQASPSSISLCAARARQKISKIRRATRGTFVALSVAGFIRSEGGIYVGPSVIYRFRWHTRYRYTDIDTSLVGERDRCPLASSFLAPSLPAYTSYFY